MKWIKCEDRLPDHSTGKGYLVYGKRHGLDRFYYAVIWIEIDGREITVEWREEHNGMLLYGITHWAEIEAPE